VAIALSALTAIPLLASLVLSYRASSDTVYVAADSRLTPTAATSAQPPTDTTCKIRVLNDGVVFVGTGNALFSADRVRTNIYAVAARVAASLPRRPPERDDIRRIAFAWRATVHARLLAMIEAHGPLTDAAAISTTGTTGSFYAATSDGEVYGITVRVGADADGRLQDIEEPEAQTGYLIATGTNEAKQQALAAAPQYAQLPWPGRLEAIEAETIRVEAERYGRRSDIGGPIDLIEINSKGPVWLARKAACR
jgi:hypothetical protein